MTTAVELLVLKDPNKPMLARLLSARCAGHPTLRVCEIDPDPVDAAGTSATTTTSTTTTTAPPPPSPSLSASRWLVVPGQKVTPALLSRMGAGRVLITHAGIPGCVKSACRNTA